MGQNVCNCAEQLITVGRFLQRFHAPLGCLRLEPLDQTLVEFAIEYACKQAAAGGESD